MSDKHHGEVEGNHVHQPFGIPANQMPKGAQESRPRFPQPLGKSGDFKGKQFPQHFGSFRAIPNAPLPQPAAPSFRSNQVLKQPCPFCWEKRRLVDGALDSVKLEFRDNPRRNCRRIQRPPRPPSCTGPRIGCGSKIKS